MLLITGAELMVTMDPSRRVLRSTGVAVDGGRIVRIAGDDDLRAEYPGADEFDAGGGWITPGMFNTHQHLTGDRLARCTIPDDLAPGAAIFTWAVPLHQHHQPSDDELSATASCSESLRNGVTFVVEAGTVAHPDRVAAAMAAIGIRGTIGTWGWDIEEGPFTGTTAEVLERQRAVVEAHPAGAGLVTGWVTLVGHDLMSDALLVGASELARDMGTGLTFHLSPTRSDTEQWTARTGLSPLVHFDRLGALGPHVLLGHGVHLDADEVDLVVGRDLAVAYCPWAYLRLGQGASVAGRHAEMWARGARIALGCDSENAGDQLDVLRAAALAAGLAKDSSMDPTRFGAVEVFEMATIGGARAVGRAHDLGSIEVGKLADLVIHATDGPNWQPPGGDPYLQLVWGTDGRSVRDVLVDGQVVVRDGQCTNVDATALGREVRRAGRALLGRAGLG